MTSTGIELADLSPLSTPVAACVVILAAAAADTFTLLNHLGSASHGFSVVRRWGGRSEDGWGPLPVKAPGNHGTRERADSLRAWPCRLRGAGRLP